MKALRANLICFFEESKAGDQEIKDRLEELVTAQLLDVEDLEIRWIEDAPPSRGPDADLAARLERLDT